MIIKNNLASAPTLNYSIYVIGCVVLAVITVSFTLYNLFTLTRNYSDTSALLKSISDHENRLSKLDQTQAALSSEISKIKTEKFITETEFINQAIKRRTFSWTSLFDRFEEILPDSVKTISIHPAIKDEEISLRLELAGRDLQSMVETVHVFENHEAFSDVTLQGENADTDGFLRFSLSMKYTPLPENTPVSPGGTRR